MLPRRMMPPQRSISARVKAANSSGVVVDGVEYQVDCLIFATGFEVGTDYARRGEAPFDYLFRRFVPRLERELAQRLLVQNPAAAFAW